MSTPGWLSIALSLAAIAIPDSAHNPGRTEMSLTVNRIRLRYRLWRIDQAEKMTAERAGYIVAAGCIASFAAITALLHLPTPQYVAGVAVYAVALLSGIRTGIEAARDFDREEDQ